MIDSAQLPLLTPRQVSSLIALERPFAIQPTISGGALAAGSGFFTHFGESFNSFLQTPPAGLTLEDLILAPGALLDAIATNLRQAIVDPFFQHFAVPSFPNLQLDQTGIKSGVLRPTIALRLDELVIPASQSSGAIRDSFSGTRLLESAVESTTGEKGSEQLGERVLRTTAETPLNVPPPKHLLSKIPERLGSFLRTQRQQTMEMKPRWIPYDTPKSPRRAARDRSTAGTFFQLIQTARSWAQGVRDAIRRLF